MALNLDKIAVAVHLTSLQYDFVSKQQLLPPNPLGTNIARAAIRRSTSAKAALGNRERLSSYGPTGTPENTKQENDAAVNLSRMCFVSTTEPMSFERTEQLESLPRNTRSPVAGNLPLRPETACRELEPAGSPNGPQRKLTAHDCAERTNQGVFP